MSGEWNGYSLIIDPIDVSASLPFEIVPDYWFRKADTMEIDRIKNQVSAYQYSEMLFEFDYIESGENRQEGHRLPFEKWKYYVISFFGNNAKLRDIEYAANLIKNEINLGFTFINNVAGITDGIGMDISMVSNIFAERHGMFVKPKTVNNDDLSDITNNYKLIVSLDKTRYPNISKAVSDFHQTKVIPNRSMLKILSYFSIVEGLLTHKPSKSDTIDSITRQIKTKLSLLNKRFKREINYKTFFPGINEIEKVWEKLYDYRSSITHGDNFDFKLKYALLISPDNILLFLRENIKILIIYALNDPEFIVDFQKC